MKNYALPVRFYSSILIALVFLMGSNSTLSIAQTTINFGSSALVGENLTNPTSLQFGPDNRLYVSQQNGTIFAYTIQKNATNSYSVISTETINLIRNIPNHDDDGSPNTAINTRQVTGLLVVGTAANPIIYVCSSDPRIGGGGTAGDKNLDTNSGILSKLTWNGTSWVKTDIVKGLPRSEENHSSNGLTLETATNTLFIASGGHTNAGSPSNNFAFITEYALSAAILKIDLNTIETQFGGSYTLPTLDDPTRANTGANNSDINDPWGGNDGVNQAKLIFNGPVQIHSAGYRNAYDLLITKTPGKEGRMYTIDNGANGGWGGYPDKEGTSGVTNNYVPGEPGSTAAGISDAKVNNRDNLHLVSAPGLAPIYGGHPNPIRANPAGAGLYAFNNTTGLGTFSLNPTVDWPPVPVTMADPVEADYRNPGVNDGALYTWGSSTNGIAEYTSAANFNGELRGDLLAASFDGNIYRIKLNSTGTSVVSVSVLAGGFGSQPLDVIAQGDNDIFPGTVWAVTYGASSITVFEPVVPTEVWSNVVYNSSGTIPPVRHENGFAEVNGKFYLIGGRVEKNVNVFDPVTKVWSLGAASPIELHHFQAVVYNDEIYAIGAMTGSYPNEVPVQNIYKYSPQTNTWSIGASIPADRRRGSSGVVLYNNKFYIVCGIQNGHRDGWVSWVDEYDPQTGVWRILPDAPIARDHFMASLSNGKIYVAAGRQTHYPDFAANTIAEVNVFDIESNTWSTPTQIPTQRGAPGVAFVNGELVVAGGEIAASSSALSVVEAYNPLNNSWLTKPSLNIGRHATQMIYYQGKLFLCAGANQQGGNGQTNSMSTAVYVANCTGDVNNFLMDDDHDGFSNGDETANGTDPCSSASKPNDFDLDEISNLIDPDDDNDGLDDKVDKFSLDKFNGTSTSMPIDYPFLNGNPGFGLFGLGFTGLMSNNTTDYKENYDIEKPNLVMGGAVGIATAPADSGDALTNDQKYAFQFGINVNQNTLPFTIQGKILGSSFFDGASGSQLGSQSQGMYFGTGDQDNYLKLVLHANNGNPGIQILIENGGEISYQNIFPVANILSASAIDLFIDINPATGLVQCKYKTNSSTVPVSVGPVLTMTGNVLRALQDNNALAVGLIATSGDKSPYTASWDYIKVINSTLQTLTEVIRINTGGSNVQYGDQFWKADQYFNGGKIFSSNTEISKTENDVLYQTERFGNMTYNIPVPQSGKYTVDLHFAELYFTSSGRRIFNINVENGQYLAQNIDLFKDYGGRFAASVTRAENVQVNDGLLTIVLANVVDNAKISGISVFFQSDAPNRPPTVSKPEDITLTSGERWAYQISASDPDAGATLTYSATNLPSSLMIDPNTGIISGIVSAGAGPYTINVTVKDQFNLTATTNFVITVPSSNSANLTEVVRINAGGPNLQLGTELWKADQNFNGGKVYKNTVSISNTTNDVLYQTERFGNMTYSIPVPQQGKYTVELHFAELYFQNSGSRIFTADIENGQFRMQDADLNRDYGGPFKAIVIRAQDIQVVDGILNFSFTNVVDNAKISGIAVFLQSSTTIENSAPVVVKPPNITVSNGQSFSYQVIASDNDLGSVLTYSASNLPSSLTINPTTGLISGTLTSVGTSTIMLSVSDQQGLSSSTNFQIIVNSLNQQPVITKPSDMTLSSGQAFNYQVLASDPDSAFVLTYSATNLPPSLSINATSGLISGSLTAPAGTFTVLLSVSDQQGLSSSTDFKITITDSNLPPVITKPDNFSRKVGQTFNYQVIASDPDDLDSVLTYSASNLPASLVINASTGLISGTVTGSPNTYSVSLSVSDQDGLAASTSFLLTVKGANNPPKISQPANLVVKVNQVVNYQINASDPDSADVLTYSALNLPASLVINSSTGLISGNVLDVTGTHTVNLTVTDQDNGTASTNFTINVEPATTVSLAEVIRINTGGPGVQFGNEQWKADQYFTGGTVFSVLNPISNTVNDALYQTERFGNFSYNIPVPNSGKYTVELHFAELYFSASGRRIFNVSIEGGQFALQNIDLYKDYGGRYAASVIKAENLQVSDGVLNISLSKIIDNAKISGIAVYFQSDGTNNQVPTANAGLDKTITLPTSSVILNGLGSDPEDGANVTYEWSQISGPSTAVLNGSLQEPTVSNLSAGTYIFNLIVKDQELLSSASDRVTVIVNSSSNGQQVLSFSLINANTDQEIQTIESNTTLNLATLQSRNLNIRANTSPSIVGRVVFALTGTQTRNQSETGAPYALFGDSNGNYNSWTPTVGSYTLKATPYSTSAGGIAGTPLTINFNVINKINQPPVITSAVDRTAIRGESFSFQVLAIDPEDGTSGLVYSASGLPEGLMINTSTGLISGTVTDVASDYQVTLNVKDKDGLSAVAVGFKITVSNANQAPVITSAGDRTATRSESFSYLVEASDPEDGTSGLVYSASGLPEGLTINTTTGLVSGTVTALAGEYEVTLNVKDKDGLSAVAVGFKITVSNANQAPVITSASDRTAIGNEAFNYQVEASDPEDGTSGLVYSANGLPEGLVINASTGLISGTVTAVAGEYQVTLGVQDKNGLAAVAVGFKITVGNANQAPVITSVGDRTAIRAESFSYQVEASDPEDGKSGLVYSASGLPEGLIISNATGLISGTVTAVPGDYEVTLSVEDKDGLAAVIVSFQITVRNANQAPVITSVGDLTAIKSESFSYQVEASDPEDGSSGLVFSANGLPEGLVINTATGLISGTVTAIAGDYEVTLNVKDEDGLAAVAVSFKITVSNANQAPVITSGGDLRATRNESFSYQVEAGDPEDGSSGLAYSANGLPEGLVINTATGLISGTVTAQAGDYEVTLNVKDEDGLAAVAVSFKITVSNANQAPVITSGGDLIATRNESFSYQVEAGDPEDGSSGLVYSANGLPEGLVINTATGLISGTVTAIAGDYEVTLNVKDEDGLAAVAVSFKITVSNANQAPVITQPLNQAIIQYSDFNYQVLANDPEDGTTGLLYLATDLPEGLTISSSSGLIAGTVTAIPGEYRVTLIVTDQDGLSGGEMEFTMTVSISNRTPEMTEVGDLLATANEPFSYQIVANDPDQNAILSFSATGLPEGLTIDNTGIISGTPTNSSGDYPIIVTAADNHNATDQVSFAIRVNNKPILTTPAPITLSVGEFWEYYLLVSDADADPIHTYSASGLPAGLAIDVNSGKISGFVTAEAGTYAVSVIVNDETNLSTNISFEISVMETATQAMTTDSLPLKGALNIRNRNFQGDELTVYPNPAQKNFSIRFNVKTGSEWNFKMSNALGRVIEFPTVNLEKGLRTVSFDLNAHNLIPGVYYFIISNNLNEKKTAKIIIN